MKKDAAKLRKVLEGLYERYNRRELIKPDPLQFVYRYSEPGDMEIAGFLAALLAYGRVQQIERDVGLLLGRMGKSPRRFVERFDQRKRAGLAGFKHRFTKGDDISDLLVLLRQIIDERGSIEEYFAQGLGPGDENVTAALARFCDSLLEMHREKHGGRVSRGLVFLLASPSKGSACKRLNLFLRWMVRKDEVDAGLWKAVDRSKLIVPVDVHIGRLSRILGFHSHKSISMKTAIAITNGFAAIEPNDPVKYDFSLSRIGIVEQCTGRLREGCEECDLMEWCLERKDWRR